MEFEELFRILQKAHPDQDWTPEIGKDRAELTVADLHVLRSLTAQYRVQKMSFNGKTMLTDNL